MALFGKIGAKGKAPKVFVLGLDGTPYSLVTRMIREGRLPNFARIVKGGSLLRINSVVPTVSPVAWACFMTGKNPGKHNIFGFVERTLEPFQTRIISADMLRGDTLWDLLNCDGKRTIVINVPVTYPPREVDGIQVSGFLCPSVEKSTYPPQFADVLKKMGYVIDVDPWLARESREQFLTELHRALRKRFELVFRLLAKESWDFFMCHVMETDRLHHFLWKQMEEDHPVDGARFYNLYTVLDDLIGELKNRLPREASLVVISDHGFCRAKREVELNCWLARQGWLKFTRDNPESLADIHPESIAYSLIPGRIFINLKGREPIGSVEPGRDYDTVRQKIVGALLALRDPQDGVPVLKDAILRERLYVGPATCNAADIVAAPNEGYELKARLGATELYCSSELSGTHTYEDAFLFVENGAAPRAGLNISDAMPTILEMMGCKIPRGIDSASCLAKRPSKLETFLKRK
jgi:predicted AlkP superfamily phosphohydrolase/phosphomutase